MVVHLYLLNLKILNITKEKVEVNQGGEYGIS